MHVCKTARLSCARAKYFQLPDGWKRVHTLPNQTRMIWYNPKQYYISSSSTTFPLSTFSPSPHTSVSQATGEIALAQMLMLRFAHVCVLKGRAVWWGEGVHVDLVFSVLTSRQMVLLKSLYAASSLKIPLYDVRSKHPMFPSAVVVC